MHKIIMLTIWGKTMTGKELQQWMDEMGFSHNKLSALTGVSPMTLRSYRNGRANIPLKVRLALSAIQARLEPVGSDCDNIPLASATEAVRKYRAAER